MTTDVTIAPTPILAFLNNQGQPCVGGTVLTQVGGVNTATYQDSAGTIPLPNPIPLNNRGEISNAAGVSCQLFLISGVAYVFTLLDANGNQLNQANYVTPPASSGSLTAFITALTTALAAPTGATLIGYLPPGVGATPRTIASKFSEEISITDKGMAVANTAAQNTVAWAAMISDIQSGTFSSIYVPPGIFQFNQVADVPKNILIYGHGFNSQLQFTVLPVSAGSFASSGGSPGRQYSVASAGTTDWGACGAQLVNATQFGLSLTAGKQYVIKTVGTTNWVALGAASSAVGVIFMATAVVGTGSGVAWERSFTATAAGTGTGTAQPDAMRFTGSVMGSGLQNLTITTSNGGAAVVAIEGGAGTNGNGGSQRNFFISRVNFGGSVCAYAIDHRNDYGIAIEHCLLNGITGSGVRLRDNGAIPNYSYSSKIRGCDFTATSGVQIEAENGGSQGPISIADCILENGTSGLLCNTSAVGGGFGWNISLDNTYFEQMAGLCISINRNGAASFINSHLLLKSTYIQGTVDLGDVGQLVAISCTNQGAANAPLCTITGSSFATTTLIDCNGFTQSGTFAWLPQGAITSWTPTISGVTTSGVTGFYSISGRTVTAQLRFTVTAAPTGNIALPLPVPFISGSALATFYSGNALIGSAAAHVAGSTFYTGGAFYNSSIPAVLFEGPSTANFWQAGVPAVWANGDYLHISLSYQI